MCKTFKKSMRTSNRREGHVGFWLVAISRSSCRFTSISIIALGKAKKRKMWTREDLEAVATGALSAVKLFCSMKGVDRARDCCCCSCVCVCILKNDVSLSVTLVYGEVRRATGNGCFRKKCRETQKESSSVSTNALGLDCAREIPTNMLQ